MATKAIDTILNLRDNFSKVINQTTNATKQFQRQVKMAENQAKTMRESVASAFSSTALKIGGIVGVLGLGEFAKSSIELASDLVEIQNVVDTTFGDASSKINDFASTTVEQFGISSLSAKKYAGQLGSILKSAGMATDQMTEMSEGLTGLAGDMASFWNISTDDAFEKLKSGITGMSKPLKDVGIDIDDTTVKAYAMANGFTGNWKEASMATKELYRYQTIMQQASHYQGDFAKTSGSFANQMRIAKMQVASLGSNIATYALPALGGLLQGFNDFIKSINIKDVMENKVIPVFNEIGKVISTVKDNMKTIMPIISGVVGGLVGFMAIGKVTSEVKNFLKVINGIAKLTNPFYLIATGIGLLIAGLVNAYNTSDDFRARVNNLFDKLMGFGDYAGNTLPGLLDNLTNVFQNDLQPALDNISKVAVDIVDFVSDHWTTIKPIVEKITEAVIAWKVANIATQFSVTAVSIATKAWGTIEMVIWGIKNATNAWEAAQWALDVAMDANPIGVVIGLITLLGLGIYELVTHWQEIWGWINKVWDVINSNPILLFISYAINPLGTALMELITHWDDICSSVQWAWDKLKGFWDWWNGTSFADKTVNINENTKTTTDGAAVTVDSGNDDVGANATGTQYWRGGATKINEYGGEMAVLPSGSKVIPADKTDKLLSNKGGIYIPVTIQGNVIGNEEFANQLGQHFYNQIHLQMINS